MDKHPVVTHEAWIEARKTLLEREKELTRLRDEISRERRALPWEKVEKDYQFDTPSGRKSLAELFDGRSQLVIYHFMFGPDWEQGCPSCTWWAETIDRNAVHLKHRDTTLMAVSRAPLAKLEAYKARMGWAFPWASSGGGDFNFDYGVSFSEAQVAEGWVDYNYAINRDDHVSTEQPGISVFFRRGEEVFHTYSCYARGIDAMNGGYQYLDLTPKGRDEEGLPHPMAWLRRRDQYEE